MLCLSLVFQTGLSVWGEELLVSEGEPFIFEEEVSAGEVELPTAGAEAPAGGEELPGAWEESSAGENDLSVSEEQPSIAGEEGALSQEGLIDAAEDSGVIFEAGTNTGVDGEGLLEDPDGEELLVITMTETVTLSDPSVVSDTAPSVSARMFRMAQYNGCFGNQLSGSALELYNARVNYYVANRKTGAMVLTYSSSSCPYTFEAEVIQKEDGLGINKDTEAYEAFKQQILFDLQSSLDAFIYDHPEIFWLRGGKCSYTVSAVGSDATGWVGYISKLTYMPTVAFSGADSLVSEYDAAVSAVVAQIRARADINGNGYIEQMELIMTAHDYLCDRFYYDSVAYANYPTTGDYRIFCSAGGFLDSVGTGVVCEGYAKSFKVICDQLGIPCVLIGGTVVQNGKIQGHMWNGVQINGKWYLMDVTWDDTASGHTYKYFMVGDITSGRTSTGNFGGTSSSTTFVYPQLEAEDLVYCLGMVHAEFTEKVVEPTCNEQGYTEYTCTKCGFSYRDHFTAVDPDNHDYQTAIVAPTCTGRGYTAHICSRCGDTYADTYVNALGHVYSNGVCSRCGMGDSIVNASVSSISSQAYGAKALTPAVTVKFGTNVLKQGTDYKITYKDNVKLGTAYATVTGIGKYSGTVIRSFKIVQKSISAVTVSAIKDRTYTGKAQTPAVTLKNNGVKLVKNTDYTISYSKNTSIGQAVITVKGKGKYSGTRKIYFNIIPKTPTLSKVTSASKGKLTASWKKVSGVSGYQIQYSLNRDFSSVKSVTASSAASSKTISSLTKGKVYYVRVRSYKKVGSKKYYSAWSQVKKVTVKK